VVEREEPRRSLKVERPVYFIGGAAGLFCKRGTLRLKNSLLANSEAVLITKRKLRHYFDAHPITVVSKYPPGEMI
jgi:hypothetical protein